MSPLRPTPGFLRRLAALLRAAPDRKVRAWADAIDRRFSSVSIVPTYRVVGHRRRLCGYEVWRHLAPSNEDPRRHKARLWFGCRHWRTELGYDRAAFDMARKAAARMRRMTRAELNRWWNSHRRCSKNPRQPDDHIIEARLDYADLAQMSHVFMRNST